VEKGIENQKKVLKEEEKKTKEAFGKEKGEPSQVEEEMREKWCLRLEEAYRKANKDIMTLPEDCLSKAQKIKKETTKECLELEEEYQKKNKDLTSLPEKCQNISEELARHRDNVLIR